MSKKTEFLVLFILVLCVTLVVLFNSEVLNGYVKLVFDLIIGVFDSVLYILNKTMEGVAFVFQSIFEAFNNILQGLEEALDKLISNILSVTLLTEILGVVSGTIPCS